MNWDERKYFSCNRYPYSGVDLSVVKNLADDSKNITLPNKVSLAMPCFDIYKRCGDLAFFLFRLYGNLRDG